MGNTRTYTEQELVALLRNKDREGFNHLYQNYSGALFGVISRIINDEHTSQEVLQDVFVKIWNSIANYDPAKGKLYTWMLNIARNSAIDRTRSRGEIMKAKIHTGENVVNNLERSATTEQAVDTIGLRKMVSDLKPEYADIIELAYFKGYTMEDIAKTLEIPSGTVKTRMRSALGKLRKIFEVN